MHRPERRTGRGPSPVLNGPGAGRRRRLLAATVGLLLVAIAVVVGTRARDDGAAGSPVTRSSTSFQVDGQPFRFVGFNLFDAAATSSYSCASWPRYTDAELDAAFRYVHDEAGATVVRFWAYQTYTRGGTDFSGVDRVLAAARRHGLRVLPVLEDGPGYCTTGPAGQAKYAVDGDTWYASGYRRPYGSAALSYRDYARVVVAHYRGNPTILGWSLMNEAETSARGPGGSSGLLAFTRDMTDVVKTADPTHLLTVGTQSNSAPGASGADFAAVYGVAGVDFTEVHDWATRGSDTSPMPGASVDGRLPSPDSATCTAINAPVACSVAISVQRLGKPLVVGEAGIAAADPSQRSRRAQLLGAKMDAAFAAGVSGYLVWQFNKVLDTEHFDVQDDTDDPLVPQMRALAARLLAPATPARPPAAAATPVSSGAARPDPSALVSTTSSPPVVPTPVVSATAATSQSSAAATASASASARAASESASASASAVSASASASARSASASASASARSASASASASAAAAAAR